MAKSGGGSDDYNYIFKLVIIGDPDVGKTNLLLRFTRDQFNLNTKTTIGVEFAYKLLTIEGKKIQNQLWDTAGQERFKAIIPQLFRGSDGVLVVFDLTKSDTFDHVTNWIEEVYQNTASDLPIILIGNKSDLVNERKVEREKAVTLAKRLNISYMETSALTATNVDKAFITLVTNIYQKKKYTSVITPVGPTPKDDKPIPTIPIASEPTIKITRFSPLDNDEAQVPKKRGCCETS